MEKGMHDVKEFTRDFRWPQRRRQVIERNVLVKLGIGGTLLMTRSGILGRTAAGLGAVAFGAVVAVAGTGQAAADPGVCVSGPLGYGSACVDAPQWVDWDPGVNWGPPGQVKNDLCPGNPPGHWKGGPHGVPCS